MITATQPSRLDGQLMLAILAVTTSTRTGVPVGTATGLSLRGGFLVLTCFFPVPLQAQTSAPLLVSLQEDEALIIAHR
eukprot:4472246-Prymnesium_polylepis.1